MSADRTATDTPLLRITHVSREYPLRAGLRRRGGVVHAVTDVSFDVAPGEVFGLVGESGCGKSTLARMIVALEEPDGGEVLIGGRRLSALSGRELRSARRDVQLMFQDPDASLDPRRRVGTSIAEPLAIQRVGARSERRARVSELIAEVGLNPSIADRYPHELSGGQRQRIGLARALVLRPKLIVADEPVSALDVSVQAQVLNLLREVRTQHQLTCVIISHDLAVVRYLADRIGVMYLGHLVEIGSGDALYETPAHPYTAGLLAAVPRTTGSEPASTEVIGGELPSALAPPDGCPFHPRCPRVRERCIREAPVLRSFGADHLAACHEPLIAPEPDTATLNGPVAGR